MKATKSTKKPTYSLEFKQDSAKLVLEKGYSCQKAADHESEPKRGLEF